MRRSVFVLVTSSSLALSTFAQESPVSHGQGSGVFPRVLAPHLPEDLLAPEPPPVIAVPLTPDGRPAVPLPPGAVPLGPAPPGGLPFGALPPGAIPGGPSLPGSFGTAAPYVGSRMGNERSVGFRGTGFHDAVWQLPTVTQILPGRAGDICNDDECAPPSADCFRRNGSSCGGKEEVALRHFFRDAAHFPLPGFDLDGGGVDREGVLIYEGMRVILYKDGVYEVSFVARAESWPTTLRIVLEAHPKATDPKGIATEPPIAQAIQLTIPPIKLNFDRFKSSRQQSNVWRVRYVGYSPALNELSLRTSIAFSRTGVAQFGEVPRTSIYGIGDRD